MLRAMKRGPVLLGLVGIALASGCAERYRVVGEPFCASQDRAVDGRFGGQYAVAMVGGNSSVVGAITGSSPTFQWTFPTSKVRAALLECQGEISGLGDGWDDDFDDTHVPSICASQRVIFNQMLDVVVTERSKGLGFAGDLQFPKVQVGCAEGTLVQRNDYTFGQIMTDFENSVDRYVEVNKSMPATMAELTRETKQPPLPPDPWGTELVFEGGPTTRLLSAGPDKQAGTEDDIEVLNKQADQSTHVMSFRGTEYSSTGDYQAFLAQRGVK